MAITWTNADGLKVRLGKDEATAGQGGEYNITQGPYHMTELYVDYTDFGSSAAVVDDDVMIPAGARIDRVDFVTETAFDSSGDGFTMNIGLAQQSATTGAYSELDYDGLVVTSAQSQEDAAGETTSFVIGHGDVGALVGTTLSANGYPTVDYDTAAPTVGAGIIRIFWRIP